MEKNESLTKSAFLSQIISIYHLQRFKIVLSVLILPLRVLSGLKSNVLHQSTKTKR